MPRSAPHPETVAQDLRRINRAVRDSGRAEDAGGVGLGGPDGYPIPFENEVFSQHPYCWCEQEDCPWCATCVCPDEAYTYWIGDRQVTGEQWSEHVTDHGVSGTRMVEVPDGLCANCRRGPDRFAPNFLHKPTGTTVRFYKYIGRGMDIDVRGNWDDILIEVLTSLR